MAFDMHKIKKSIPEKGNGFAALSDRERTEFKLFKRRY